MHHPDGHKVGVLYSAPEPDHPLRRLWGIRPDVTPYLWPETALTALLDEVSA
jgi:hypothetical protein